MELIKKIAEKFNKEGYCIFEVGGSVRDSLLGREPSDFDLTTNALPAITKKLIEEFGSVYDIGEAYGTIGLVTEDKTQIEITTFRKEVYASDTRKPVVEFSTDNSFASLYEDLSRRDFTINAIAREPITGTIIDPFRGEEDLRKKSIRCVGKDLDRFNEDPLRMMRAVRFACQLGFYLDVNISRPERLRIVSNERIRDELSKILLTRRAAFGIQKLCQSELMNYIIPEFIELRNIEQGKYHFKDAFRHSLMVVGKSARISFNDDTLIFRLACLLHDIGKPETKTEDETGVHFYSHQYFGAKKAERILTRLHYDNHTIESVRELVYHHMSPLMLHKGYEEGGLTKRAVTRLIRKIGEDNIYMLLGLVKCDMRSSKNSRREFLKFLTNLVAKCMEDKPMQITSPLDGNDIMKFFGLKPSPLVGEIKEFLTNLVIDGKIDKDDKILAISEVTKKLREDTLGGDEDLED